MRFDEFIAKWNGKLLDWDGYYGGQCVDLYRQYCQEVLQIPQSPPVVGAKDIWGSYLKKHFDRINNDPMAVPVKGDIVIWDKYAGGGYGHVGVFVSGSVNSFESFDENWPVGSVCHIQKHNYTNVLGWLHPKNTHVVVSDDDLTLAFLKQVWPREEFEKLEAFARELVGVHQRSLNVAPTPSEGPETPSTEAPSTHVPESPKQPSLLTQLVDLIKALFK